MRSITRLFPFFLACAPALANAQGIGTSPTRGALKFEVSRPNIDDDGMSITSAAYYLGAHIPISSGNTFVLELPFARYARETDFVSVSSSTVGNPYIGLGATRGRAHVDVGVRIPLAKDDESAAFLGAIADQNRLEAFLPDYGSLRTAITWAAFGAQQTLVQFTVGPTILVPFDSEDEAAETELFFDYATRAAGDRGAVQLMAAIEGRAVVTEEGDAGERTEHQAVVAASYAFGNVRPGLIVRIPLDKDAREFTSSTIGVTLQIALR
jgi:hypothetical protein